MKNLNLSSVSTLALSLILGASAIGCGLQDGEGADDTTPPACEVRCDDGSSEPSKQDDDTSGGVDTDAHAHSDDGTSVAVNVTVNNGDTDASTNNNTAGAGGSGGSGGGNTAGTGNNAGSGGSDDGCDSDCDPDPAPECSLPAPFVPDGRFMNFSTEYISGSVEGEIRGTLPNNTWEEGYEIADGGVNGYIGMEWTGDLPEGTYDFSYMDGRDAWAHYGKLEHLLCMPESALDFILCNWINDDGSVNEDVYGAEAECHIQAYWDGDDFFGTGNAHLLR